MSKAAAILLFAILLVAAAAAPTRAWQGHGGFHGGGHGFHPGFHHHLHSHAFIAAGPWWGPAFAWSGPFDPWYAPYPYWGYWGNAPYWWYGPGLYPYPSAVLQEPQRYIQQRPASAQGRYWYYCASAKEYYPKIGGCPEAWIRVPATPR
jgi:hypothetical protein